MPSKCTNLPAVEFISIPPAPVQFTPSVQGVKTPIINETQAGHSPADSFINLIKKNFNMFFSGSQAPMIFMSDVVMIYMIKT